MYNLVLFFNDIDRATMHVNEFEEIMSNNDKYIMDTKMSIGEELISVEHVFINKQECINKSLNLN